MSTNIKLKRSAVQGKVPATTDLDFGELAINTYDGKLFLKKDDGTESIVDVTSGGSSTVDIQSFTYNSTNGVLSIVESDTTQFTANLDLDAFSTTDLSEGTNLYYTTSRANAAIDNRVTKSFVDALNVDADTLDGQQGSYYLDWTNVTNKPDPTLTLTGDVSGTATFTNLGNVTLTATVADNSHNHIISNIDGLQTALDDKAPLSSPALTGTPTAPTASEGTNTTQIATTAFVSGAISNLIDTAPSTLDTLNELASALGDDPNFATTISNQLGNKADKSTAIIAGSGLTIDIGGNLSSNTLISHADTSSQGSLSALGGPFVVSDIDLDGFGHVTNLSTRPLTLANLGYNGDTNADNYGGWSLNVDSNSKGTVLSGQTVNFVGGSNVTLDYSSVFRTITINAENTDTTYFAGSGIGLSGTTFNVDAGPGLTQETNGLSHADTSSQLSIFNSNGFVIQDIVLDGFGHITDINSINLDDRYYTESEIDTRLTNGTVTTINDQWSNQTGNLTGYVNDGGGNLGIRFNATPGGTNTLVEDGIAYEIQVDSDNFNGDFNIYQGSTSTGSAGETISWTNRFRIDGSGNLFANGSNRIFDDSYHPNADKLTTSRTISLGGDLSGSASFDGSANITISASVADDSHNHTIANVDGLQTALNGKLDTTQKAADSNLFDGLNSTQFLRSDTNDTFTTLTGNSLVIGAGVVLGESNIRPDVLQITSNTSNWGGLQIRNSSNHGVWSFMTNLNRAGIYDEQNAKWAINMDENSEVRLYFNGIEKLNTSNNGVGISGELTASGNVTAFSDVRLKSNIKTIEDPLGKITKLRGVNFTKDDKPNIGVIAQEVQKVLPEVVHQSDEYLSVAYGNMVGLLIEAIKDQQKQINELKSKLEEK